ncbi:MAG: GAF domain-containing protein [Chitinivibrionia bacterium]|nr:GAF domain-containing protein [Chitinivibrionia bacterium]
MGESTHMFSSESGSDGPKLHSASGAVSARALKETSRLEHSSWRNWILLAGLAVLTTVGLSVSLAPSIFETAGSFWSWKRTDIVLLSGLVVLVVLFVSYLTVQQRQVVRMRMELRAMEADAQECALRNSARLHALLNVSRFVGTELDRAGVFDCITRTSTEVFDSHWSSLMLHNKQTGELDMHSMFGTPETMTMVGILKHIGHGIALWSAKERKPLMLNPSSNLERFLGPGYDSCPTIAAMAAPVMLGEELIGVVSVCRYNSTIEYDDDDLRALLVFAENAGAFIRNAERIEILIGKLRFKERAPLAS